MTNKLALLCEADMCINTQHTGSLPLHTVNKVYIQGVAKTLTGIRPQNLQWQILILTTMVQYLQWMPYNV